MSAKFYAVFDGNGRNCQIHEESSVDCKGKRVPITAAEYQRLKKLGAIDEWRLVDGKIVVKPLLKATTDDKGFNWKPLLVNLAAAAAGFAAGYFV